MRVIKFRATNINTGEWCYGDLIRINAQRCIIQEKVNRGRDNEFIGHPCTTDTIGQFTGLKDKNGKEIYEGDIIGCHNPNIKHLIFYNEAQGRFMAALNGDIENDYFGVCGLDSSHWNSTKVVIGNIYDNPELLEGGTE